MCFHCEAGIPHECRETGAFETGGQTTWYGTPARKEPTSPYLNPDFKHQPANADGPRRTEDMHRKDYVYHDPRIASEEEVVRNFRIFQVHNVSVGEAFDAP